MNSPIKPLERARALTAYFSPQVVGEVNDVNVKVAKIKGDDIPWHDAVKPGRPSDEAAGDLVEITRLQEQEAAVDRPAGDLDQGVGRNVA